MATVDNTAAPTYARKVWCDAYNIFIEVPHTTAIPYVAKFPRSEGGLAKALAILAAARDSELPPGGTYSLLSHPATKKITPKVSTEQSERAHSILKKLGMI